MLNLVGGGSFEPQAYYPGDNCCFLYDDQDFHDAKLKLCHDGEKTYHDLDDYGFDDRMDSYYCGKNVWFNFCGGTGSDECEHNNFSSGAGHYMNPHIEGFSSETSLAILGPYNPK